MIASSQNGTDLDGVDFGNYLASSSLIFSYSVKRGQ